MDMLRLFATYETTLSLAAQAETLHKLGWHASGGENSLECKNTGMTLQLEHSGDDLFLLRGELERDRYTNDGAAPLLAFLRDGAAQFQLDIFEEDGRLIRRISSAD
jgi:hypothetical protein